MANIKSNEKRARQSKKRYLRNKAWKENVKKLKKSIVKYVLSGKINTSELKKMLIQYQSLVDKTYTKNVFKKNKVARLKSRLYHFVSKHVDLKKVMSN
ncbi:MAG: 30S ribosomal protein S20 [Brevinematales bacterium]|nr:30S ribosomal protein S20 [Brevinematales bacterium]